MSQYAMALGAVLIFLLVLPNVLRFGCRNVAWNGCTGLSRNPEGCGRDISSATQNL